MLSKLIKHEFRATSRIMWPVFLGMLALTALMRFSQLLLNGEHIPWLLQLIGVLLVIGFVMGLGALAFAPLVLSAVRWRDHVLKDEGYLTLTLPVSVHELLASTQAKAEALRQASSQLCVDALRRTEEAISAALGNVQQAHAAFQGVAGSVAAPAAPAAAPAARQPEIHFEDDAPLDEEVN